ncbi:MAG: hypothetical protein JSU68_04735 [Phycisphaerales bacterium]|nr:MAG: hypothetical protein JSU68_04735 [Phycisphaerales bacterium]
MAEGILTRGSEPLRGPSGRSFETWYGMRFNGEPVRLIPATGAHSQDDLLIHFVDSGVVHMGDLYLSRSFPSAGRDVKRYLEIMDTVIDVFGPETKFIAGHGPDNTMSEVKAYRATLGQTIAVVRAGMKAGKSVEQMREEGVLDEWDSWGDYLRFLDADTWIQWVHDSYEG